MLTLTLKLMNWMKYHSKYLSQIRCDIVTNGCDTERDKIQLFKHVVTLVTRFWTNLYMFSKIRYPYQYFSTNYTIFCDN